MLTKQEIYDFPIEKVLMNQGFELARGSKSHHSSQEWTNGERKIVITIKGVAALWFDKTIGASGAGAKTLGAHLCSINLNGMEGYTQIRDYLSGLAGLAGSGCPTIKNAPNVPQIAPVSILCDIAEPPPVFVEEKWDLVRKYLAGRGLNASLLNQLKADGKIGAVTNEAEVNCKDGEVRHIKFTNAAFSRENGGYFWRSIASSPDAPKSRGCKGSAGCGCFVLGEKNAGAIVFTEGPIEAISLYQMYPSLKVVAIGGGGVPITPKLVARHSSSNDEIYGAFDLDDAGRGYMDKLSKIRADSQPFNPPTIDGMDMDWNEYLQSLQST